MLRSKRIGDVPEPATRHHEVRLTPEDLLRRLRWTVLRPLAALLGGDERSLVRGFGMELTEVREYQPGDDVRHIDWNTTARTDRPFVRESYVERALDVWFVLDVSASIDWGTAQCLKRERLLEFVGVAGQLLSHHGNRIGALLFADRPLGFTPSASGRSHLLQLIGVICDEPRQKVPGSSDLASALDQVHTLARRRALIIVITDFLTPDGWQPRLGRLAQRHEVVAVRVQDPREVELPDIGLVTLEDPETGGQLIVDTSNRQLRERFHQAADEQSKRIQSDIAACGGDLLVLSTGEELLPALAGFLTARRKRGGSASRI